MDNYILLGLNRKEIKVMEIKKNKGIIEVEVKSKKEKVRRFLKWEKKILIKKKKI